MKDRDIPARNKMFLRTLRARTKWILGAPFFALGAIILAVLLWRIFTDIENNHWLDMLLGTGNKLETIKLLGTVIGAMAIIWNGYAFTRRAAAQENTAKAQFESVQVARQDAAWRIYNDARAMISNTKSVSARISGIYDLAEIARQYPERTENICNILCAHVRETTQQANYQEKHKDQPSNEIQSLLDVLTKRDVFVNELLDFSRAYLIGSNLHKANIEKSNLSEADMQNANLSEVDMQNANLSEAKMQGADMRNANLQGADMRESKMHPPAFIEKELKDGGVQWMIVDRDNPNLIKEVEDREMELWVSWAMGKGANLREAKLQSANLYKAKMMGADLVGAQLQNASLGKADLRGVDLSRADMRKAKLNLAKLGDAILQETNLYKAELYKANLTQINNYIGGYTDGFIEDRDIECPTHGEETISNTNMRGADLRNAILQRANLSEANLQGAIISGADLSHAYLYSAKMQGADLRDAQMQGADLRDAQMLGAVLINAKLQNAWLNKAVLFGANLHSADLQNVSMQKLEDYRPLYQREYFHTDMRSTNLYKANLQDTKLDGVLLEGAYSTDEKRDIPFHERINNRRGKDTDVSGALHVPENINDIAHTGILKDESADANIQYYDNVMKESE